MSKQVDTNSIELDDVHCWDYPDFCDAFISYAEYDDGTPLTEEECTKFGEEHPDLINELAHESLH